MGTVSERRQQQHTHTKKKQEEKPDSGRVKKSNGKLLLAESGRKRMAYALWQIQHHR